MSVRRIPEIVGLVLAGGESRRMREDKGALDYHGMPQVEYCHQLLVPRCDRAFVSVNARQSRRDPYRNLPLLEDSGAISGPAAGLLAAWTAFPNVALLTLAVDLPLVDAALIDLLILSRSPERAATAWVHPDSVVEPLCTIWEPAMRASLIVAPGAGRASLSRLLEAADVERLIPPDPRQIASVNTETAYRHALKVIVGK